MASQRVEELPVARLTFGLSPRSRRADPKHVAALVEVFDQLPPILVHAETMRVIDGVHRVLAARSCGRATIQALLFHGDETAARIEAVRTNVAHGKPLTLAERQAAAAEIIANVPDWSDRRIAEVTGLSPHTVARLRGRATAQSARSRARVGRDGRLRPLDPAEVRLRVARAVQADPNASNRAIAGRTGASQGTVRDVRERLRQGLDVVLSSKAPPAARHPRRPSPSSTATGDEPGGGALQDEFRSWLDQHCVESGSWHPFVANVPISRVYEVADVCRRVSDTWREFAVALEDRARGRRRSTVHRPVKESD